MHTPSMNGFALRQRGWRGRGQERERVGGRGGWGGHVCTPCRNGFALRQGVWRERGQGRERGGGGREGITLAHARITGGEGREGRTRQGITFTFALVAEVASAFEGALPVAPILGLEKCPWNVPADMH